MARSLHVLTVLTFQCVLGYGAGCKATDANCTDSTANTTTTTQVAARATATTQVADDEKGSFYSIWSNYQVAFGFAGFLLLLFILCVVVAVRRKSNMKHRARQRERHCGLMTAAIYDIMSQSQLAHATDATGSESSAIVVEPIKPPSYEEINREAAVPQDPPPSYRESITESFRESMKDYPEHYCQSVIRKY